MTADIPYETVAADLVPGALYQFAGIMGPTDPDTRKAKWVFPPGTYRLWGIARDYRTQQDHVVYVGVGGPDDGRPYLACLADWHRDFTRVAVEDVPRG